MSSVIVSFRGTGTRQEERGICLRAFARGSHGQSVVEMRYDHKESKLEPFSAIDA